MVSKSEYNMSFVIVISTYSGLLVLTTFLTGWANRFANAGDTVIEIAESTALQVSPFFSS